MAGRPPLASVARVELDGPWAAELVARLAPIPPALTAALLALLAARRGEEGPDRPVPSADALSPRARRQLAAWRAEADLLRGRPAQAAERVAAALGRSDAPLDASCGRLLVLGLRAQADRVTLGGDLDDRSLVQDAMRAAGALARRASAVTLGAEAAACRAEHARATGPPAPQLWAAAADGWLAVRHRYDAAYCLWRQAEAVLGQRWRQRDATPVVDAGRRLAAAVGAVGLVREFELLAVRAHLPVQREEPHGPAPPPGRGERLTQREREVLRLAARGFSNRAIARALVISPKTVDTHMSHLLVKLDVHDRVAAAARAQRLGLLE